MFRCAFLRVTLEQIRSRIKLKSEILEGWLWVWIWILVVDKPWWLDGKGYREDKIVDSVPGFPYVRIHMMKISIFNCDMLNKWLLGSEFAAEIHNIRFCVSSKFWRQRCIVRRKKFQAETLFKVHKYLD